MTDFFFDDDSDGCNDNCGNFDDHYDKNDKKHTITVKFDARKKTFFLVMSFLKMVV